MTWQSSQNDEARRAGPILSRGNQNWHCALSGGRCLRILSVINDFNRKCFVIAVDSLFLKESVTQERNPIAEGGGYPCMLVSDNGTGLSSNAMFKWHHDRGLETHSNCSHDEIFAVTKV
jgi:transposase InsO family protein